MFLKNLIGWYITLGNLPRFYNMAQSPSVKNLISQDMIHIDQINKRMKYKAKIASLEKCGSVRWIKILK